MKTADIHIRDPFVLVHGGKYYLYGTSCDKNRDGAVGFDAYVGDDLENWDGPVEVFRAPADFWATRDFWAPEVHAYKGSFYMFATFKSDDRHRGTQVLKASSPLGPFLPHSAGPVTPEDWECLDGTLYVDRAGRPYMVFCHEWTQVGNGEMCVSPLSDDLSRFTAPPRVLFRAHDFDFIRDVRESNPHTPSYGHEACYITDGPFLHRCENGDLLMLWSSFGEDGYLQSVLRSESGEIDGPWRPSSLLFTRDGGHGMLFRGLDGKLRLSLHRPNTGPLERAAFFAIAEENGALFRQ